MRVNRKPVLLASLIVLSFLVRCVFSQEIAPDFTLADIDGVEFSLSDFEGKIVLLEFFATWCMKCVNEVLHLKSVHGEFGEDLVVISVSFSQSNDTVEKLQQFRQYHEIDWIIAKDNIGVSDEYDVTKAWGYWQIPALVIIDQQGYIRYEHIGLTDESVLQEDINDLMPEFLGTDLNRDGIVNIEDIAMVARAFGAKYNETDGMYWHTLPCRYCPHDPILDLDGNGTVSIADIAKVAKDFGKTA